MSSSDSKIKTRRSEKKYKIKFEPESITKDVAKQRLQEEELVHSLNTTKQKEKQGQLEKKESFKNSSGKIKKRKSEKEQKTNVSIQTNASQDDRHIEETVISGTQKDLQPTKKRRKHDAETQEECSNYLPKKSKKERKLKKDQILDGEAEKNISEQSIEFQDQKYNEETKKAEPQKADSKRAKKRKKYEQLLLEKKVKVDSDTREKCLNYLSRWKHSNNEWKFEKLRQVWLQQNIFDSDKLPDKCWEIILEYFENSKGNSRQKIIDEALKIIEQEEQSSEDAENAEENHKQISLKRARDVIQYLQN